MITNVTNTYTYPCALNIGAATAKKGTVLFFVHYTENVRSIIISECENTQVKLAAKAVYLCQKQSTIESNRYMK